MGYFLIKRIFLILSRQKQKQKRRLDKKQKIWYNKVQEVKKVFKVKNVWFAEELFGEMGKVENI